MTVLTHIGLVSSLWYTYSATLLFGLCAMFQCPVTVGLLAYLPFQDLWFYIYHRGGHYILATSSDHIPSVVKLHNRHHTTPARVECWAYMVNYLPIELVGCSFYSYYMQSNAFVVACLCVLMSASVHLGIHPLLHAKTPEQTTNPTLRRIRKLHVQHHQTKLAFSASNPVSDLLFGTLPPKSTWYD